MADTTPKQNGKSTTAPDSTPDQAVVDVLGLVPQSTRDNYTQIARDAAAATGRSPQSCLDEMAKAWEKQHELDPTGGWNYLAQWAKTADLSEDTGPTAVELATARQIESARRDPSFGLAGQPEVVAAAVESLEATPTATGGVGNDASTGVVANPGPIAVETPSTD